MANGERMEETIRWSFSWFTWNVLMQSLPSLARKDGEFCPVNVDNDYIPKECVPLTISYHLYFLRIEKI